MRTARRTAIPAAALVLSAAALDCATTIDTGWPGADGAGDADSPPDHGDAWDVRPDDARDAGDVRDVRPDDARDADDVPDLRPDDARDADDGSGACDDFDCYVECALAGCESGACSGGACECVGCPGADADADADDGGACDELDCYVECVLAGCATGGCGWTGCECVGCPGADADADAESSDDSSDEAEADAEADAGAEAGEGGILVLFEECGGGADHVTPALTNLGLAEITTFTYDAATFEAQLAGGTWGLVVVDEYGNLISDAALDLLGDHVAGGRPVIFASWELYARHASHGFLDRAGVTLSGSYSAPLAVYRWRADPLFTTPNEVPDLLPGYDLCDIDGQYGEPTTATAHGGYSGTEEPAQTALAVSADGLVILQAFMPQLMSQDADGDGKPDMVELYENEVTQLYSP
jgi:hypothetical protein